MIRYSVEGIAKMDIDGYLSEHQILALFDNFIDAKKYLDELKYIWIWKYKLPKNAILKDDATLSIRLNENLRDDYRELYAAIKKVGVNDEES